MDTGSVRPKKKARNKNIVAEHSTEPGPSKIVKRRRVPPDEVVAVTEADDGPPNRQVNRASGASPRVGDDAQCGAYAGRMLMVSAAYDSSQDSDYEETSDESSSSQDSDNDKDSDEASTESEFTLRFHGSELSEWGDWDEDGGEGVSREAQERELEISFCQCVQLMQDGKKQEALCALFDLLKNPLVERWKVAHLDSFDWKAAKTKNALFLASTARVYLGANLALAQLSPDPVPFYLQALTLCANSEPLWYLCGTAASRRDDWASAEFAYEQCGDGMQAREALALVYFMSKQWEKCLRYCRLILTERAGHEVAIVMMEQIASKGKIWSDTVDSIRSRFPFQQLHNPDLMNDLKKEILDKIAAFRDANKNHDAKHPVEFLSKLILGTASELANQRVWKIPLRDDVSAVDIANMLVNLSRAIHERSSLGRQRVLFIPPPSPPEPAIEALEDNVRSPADKAAASTEDGLSDEAIVRDVVNTMLNHLESSITLDAAPFSPSDENDSGKENLPEGPRMTGKPAKTAAKRKDVSNKTKAPCPKRRKADAVTDQPTKSKLSAADAISRRRSTRFVEEIEDPVYQPGRRSDERTRSILFTAMGLDASSCMVAPSPLEDASSRQKQEPDCIEVAELADPSTLIEVMLGALDEGRTIEEWLIIFLSWMSLQTAKLTREQADAYRKVYSCWSADFYDMSEAANATTNDLLIHLVAAELGCDGGLQFIARSLSEVPTDPHQEEAPRVATASCEDVEMSSEHAQQRLDVPQHDVDANHLVEPGAFDPFSQIDLLKHVRSRIEGRADRARPVKETVATADVVSTTKAVSGAEVREDDLWTLIDNMALLSTANIDSRSSSLDLRTDSKGRKPEEPTDEPLCSTAMRNILEDTEFCRNFLIRFHWVAGHVDDTTRQALPSDFAIESEEHFVRVASLLIDGEAIACHMRPSRSCISLGNVFIAHLASTRQNIAKRIEQLKVDGDLQEIKYILLDDFEWSSVNEGKQMDYMSLLVASLKADGELNQMADWILRLLHMILCADDEDAVAKQCFAGCLSALNAVDLDGIHAENVAGLGAILARFALSKRWRSSVDLWEACYCIAQLREGELSAAYLKDLYQTPSEIDCCMPTKALQVLMFGHESLGEVGKCDIDKGKFIRFYLARLRDTMAHPAVREVFDECPQVASEIHASCVFEAMQCLRCLCSESFPRTKSRFEDHSSSLKLTPDWELAQLALPLILPAKLPLFDDKQRIPSETLDVLQRFFKFTAGEDVDQLISDFDKFCSAPPRLRLKATERPLAPREMSRAPYCAQYLPSDPASIRWPRTPTPTTRQEQERLSLAATVQYVLAITAFRNNCHADASRLAKVVLIRGADSLPADILSSAWAMVACASSKEFMLNDDAQLLRDLSAGLFPFQMSLHLKSDVAEIHLDIGCLMYQIRTRLRRFADKQGTEESVKEKVRNATKGFLNLCQAHFVHAVEFNRINQAVEITWVAEYFLAKIAEKKGAPPATVLELYHRCALTMESECYTYPAKIHRTKQTNIEPLEIHYRVHAYAVKLVRKLRAPQLPLASANCERRVRVVREFLQVFAAYGVAKKTGSSGQAFYDTSKCTSVAALDQRDDDDLVVEHLVSDVVEMVDGVEQIEKMCRTAFETVLYKFPHYKAAYRLAEMHHNEKNNRACLNVVWNLFCGNKKSEPSALFDNITEVQRTDIDRSGAFSYHMNRVVTLAIQASSEEKDFRRLAFICTGLMRHKESLILNESDFKQCKKSCVLALVRLIDGVLSRKDVAFLRQNVSLLETIGKRCKTADEELLPLLETRLRPCIERVRAMEQHEREGRQRAEEAERQRQAESERMRKVADEQAVELERLRNMSLAALSSVPTTSADWRPVTVSNTQSLPLKQDNVLAVASASSVAKAPSAGGPPNDTTPSASKTLASQSSQHPTSAVALKQSTKRPLSAVGDVPSAKQPRLANAITASFPSLGTAAAAIAALANEELSPQQRRWFFEIICNDQVLLSTKGLMMQSFYELYIKNKLDETAFNTLLEYYMRPDQQLVSSQRTAGTPARAASAPRPEPASTSSSTISSQHAKHSSATTSSVGVTQQRMVPTSGSRDGSPSVKPSASRPQSSAPSGSSLLRVTPAPVVTLSDSPYKGPSNLGKPPSIVGNTDINRLSAQVRLPTAVAEQRDTKPAISHHGPVRKAPPATAPKLQNAPVDKPVSANPDKPSTSSASSSKPVDPRLEVRRLIEQLSASNPGYQEMMQRAPANAQPGVQQQPAPAAAPSTSRSDHPPKIPPKGVTPKPTKPPVGERNRAPPRMLGQKPSMPKKRPPSSAPTARGNGASRGASTSKTLPAPPVASAVVASSQKASTMTPSATGKPSNGAPSSSAAAKQATTQMRTPLARANPQTPSTPNKGSWAPGQPSTASAAASTSHHDLATFNSAALILKSLSPEAKRQIGLTAAQQASHTAGYSTGSVAAAMNQRYQQVQQPSTSGASAGYHGSFQNGSSRSTAPAFAGMLPNQPQQAPNTLHQLHQLLKQQNFLQNLRCHKP